MKKNLLYKNYITAAEKKFILSTKNLDYLQGIVSEVLPTNKRHR